MTTILLEPKGDDEKLDYIFEFEDLLEAEETITAHNIETTEGLTIEGTPQVDGQSIIVWLSGGEPNHWYYVDCYFSTSEARDYERSFRLRVVERR